MLMLHTCCAPCSAAIIEWLLGKNIRPVLFFFNPNIYPQEEYEIRKQELKRYAQSFHLEFIDGDYDHPLWLQSVKGLENQPERGARCLECFKIRLYATARLAQEKGCTQIATTLASSRWKDLEQIAEAGKWAVQQFPPVEFWDKNWRKDGLSERRRILLKTNGFYNQTYCGCEFSLLHLQAKFIKNSMTSKKSEFVLPQVRRDRCILEAAEQPYLINSSCSL